MQIRSRLLGPLALLTLAATGCGGGDTVTPPLPDLTATVKPDLGVAPTDLTSAADLTTVYDLLAPTCTDHLKNGSETDVDCGGSCPRCNDTKRCSIGGDCASLVCLAGVCQSPTCGDAVKNGNESDVDCGGTCPHCGVNRSCGNASDCGTGVCTSDVCIAATCTDNVKNGGEADVDCGGPCPTKCGSGKGCGGNLDCVTGVCMAGACAAASCTDKIKNGDESDVDCGGATCLKCGAGKACGGNADCLSVVCSNGTCVSPSCTDTIKNGDESDVDCGGTLCGKCGNGKMCLGAGDCSSASCSGGVCQAPTCTDTILNGVETDVDCGGGTCGGCATGLKCKLARDCASGVCSSSGTCTAPACNDNVKNGQETDVDCGGATCGPCTIGKACSVDGDCKPSLCVSGTCKYPISCAEILAHNAGVTTGDYTIQPAGISVPGTVHCDMAFVDSMKTGGWTQFLQCLPGDGCQVAGNTLMNVDWMTTDYAKFSTSKSYLLGNFLASTVTGATQLMFEITDTSMNRVGHVVYPLNSDTRKFFNSTAFYESARLQAIITDYDGSKSQRSLRICWSSRANSPYSRTLQGDTGLSFLGNTSASANENGNSGCDYGPWSCQMLMRDPNASAMNASWGVGPVGSWSGQPFAHRVFIR